MAYLVDKTSRHNGVSVRFGDVCHTEYAVLKEAVEFLTPRDCEPRRFIRHGFGYDLREVGRDGFALLALCQDRGDLSRVHERQVQGLWDIKGIEEGVRI